MSDTPIQNDLSDKKSLRNPEHLTEAIEQFRSDYNDTIRETDMDDDLKEAFLLESTSEARRRALDIGIEAFYSSGIPYGFSFDPDDFTDEGEELVCPSCDATSSADAPTFRVGAQKNNDGEITFDKVRCMGCGATRSVEELASRSPVF